MALRADDVESPQGDDLCLFGRGQSLELGLGGAKGGAERERRLVGRGRALAREREPLLRLQLRQGARPPPGLDRLGDPRVDELLGLGRELAREQVWRGGPGLDRPRPRRHLRRRLLLFTSAPSFACRGLEAVHLAHHGGHQRLPQLEPSHVLCVAAQQNVGAPPGHVGRDGDSALSPGLRDDLGLALDEFRFRVEELVRDALLGEGLGEELGALDGGGSGSEWGFCCCFCFVE